MVSYLRRARDEETDIHKQPFLRVSLFQWIQCWKKETHLDFPVKQWIAFPPVYLPFKSSFKEHSLFSRWSLFVLDYESHLSKEESQTLVWFLKTFQICVPVETRNWSTGKKKTRYLSISKPLLGSHLLLFLYWKMEILTFLVIIGLFILFLQCPSCREIDCSANN